MDLGQIETTVEGDEGGGVDEPGERQRQQIHVGVDHVELRRPTVDLGQHPQMEVRGDTFELGA